MFTISKAHMLSTLLTLGILGYACVPATAAVRIEGQVQVGGGPLANSTVTLWGASAGEPKQLAQARTGSDGRFQIDSPETIGADVILYVLAKGGEAAVKKGSGDNSAVVLLSVLGNAPPAKVVVNGLTTVASTFTSARFIRAKPSQEMRSDCGSLPGTLRTWLIPRRANGARCFLIRSTAQ